MQSISAASGAVQPPHSNTGVTPQCPPLLRDDSQVGFDPAAVAQFDWYSAGVTDAPDYILGFLQDGLSSAADVKRIYPKNGYQDAASIVLGDRTLATAMWGGNTGDRVLITATGCDAPSLASLVRSEWPDHLLIRADSKIDVVDPTAWDTLYNMGIHLGTEYRLKLKHIGDYARGQDGRTLEIGSRKSPAMARVYEKGIQMASKGFRGVSRDMVRFEAEIKPRTPVARSVCASLSPAGMFGCAPFLSDAYRLLAHEDVPRVSGLNRLKRPSDRDRALAAMTKQYAKHLQSLHDELGSWCEVGKVLGSMIDS